MFQSKSSSNREKWWNKTWKINLPYLKRKERLCCDNAKWETKLLVGSVGFLYYFGCWLYFQQILLFWWSLYSNNLKYCITANLSTEDIKKFSLLSGNTQCLKRITFIYGCVKDDHCLCLYLAIKRKIYSNLYCNVKNICELMSWRIIGLYWYNKTQQYI